MFAAEIVDHMVSYIYRRDYAVDGESDLYPASISQPEIDDGGSANVNVNDTLLVHVEVFGIGEFLQIDLLKTLAVEKFAATAAPSGWQATGFIEVVEKANERSGPSDRKLRNELRQHAMQHRGKIVKDASLMAELAGLEGVQDFAAGLFQQMVQQQIEEKRKHDERVERKNEELERKNLEIIKLQADKERLNQTMQERDTRHKERIQHIEDVMDKLVDDLQSLPTECSNFRCEREHNRLDFDRKGHAVYGKGEGDWKIRCGCRAVMN